MNPSQNMFFPSSPSSFVTPEENPNNYDAYIRCQEFFRSFLEEGSKMVMTQINFNRIFEVVKVSFRTLPALNQIWTFYISYLVKERKRKYLKKGLWNERELKILLWSAVFYGESRKKSIDDFIFPNSSANKCKIKWFTLKKSKFIKSKWTMKEDQMLFELMKTIPKNPKILWSNISQKLNERMHEGELVRTGRHCRDRWVHHLNPDLDRSCWTVEEDIFIMKFIIESGKKWANLSKIMKNRNEDSIRNRYIKLMKNEKLPFTPSSPHQDLELQAVHSILEKLEKEPPRFIPHSSRKLDLESFAEINKEISKERSKERSNKFKLNSYRMTRLKEHNKKEEMRKITEEKEVPVNPNFPAFGLGAQPPQLQRINNEVRLSLKEEVNIKNEEKYINSFNFGGFGGFGGGFGGGLGGLGGGRFGEGLGGRLGEVFGGRLGEGLGGRFGEGVGGRLGEGVGGRLGEGAAGRLGEGVGGRLGEGVAGRLGEGVAGRLDGEKTTDISVSEPCSTPSMSKRSLKFLEFFDKTKDIFLLFDIGVANVRESGVADCREKTVDLLQQITQPRVVLLKKNTQEVVSELEIDEDNKVIVKKAKKEENPGNHSNACPMNMGSQLMQELWMHRMGLMMQSFSMMNNWMQMKGRRGEEK